MNGTALFVIGKPLMSLITGQKFFGSRYTVESTLGLP